MHTVAFAGGAEGAWRITRLDAVTGDGLPLCDRLSVFDAGEVADPARPAWILRGAVSNERYVTRSERSALEAAQAPLGRAEARCAALIPIKKSDAWWKLTQDERRELFEERSRHIGVGLEYLPAVARRLHHCHDLAGEPFDFLTWFEYAPTAGRAFEELVGRLRATEEWSYVEREVDVRLERA